MFYRVRADLAFTEQDEANDFYHDCEVALPKSSFINLGMLEQESGMIQIEQCFHDEDPSIPCVIIDSETLNSL